MIGEASPLSIGDESTTSGTKIQKHPGFAHIWLSTLLRCQIVIVKLLEFIQGDDLGLARAKLPC